MRYAQIRELDISNGEGIGAALFVQGCPFSPHCKNCFNPETWDFNGGKEWTPKVKEKFLELANKPYIKRISLLGGECLADENLDGILDLVNEIRLLFPQKTIWLYTGYEVNLESYDISSVNGYSETKYEFAVTQPNTNNKSNFLRKSILNSVDVVIDGRYIDSQRDITLKWRGSSNQRVIDIKQSLENNEIRLFCE